jgi:hypothetical protein
MNSPKPIKLKKCIVCKQEFPPFNSIQPTCGKYECQVKYADDHAKKAAIRRARQQRKETREAKERIKTRAEWLREAQSVFNRYIRLRDEAEPCISCGRHHRGQYHAGHYLSVGARPELRFEETNVHKQCAPCNDHLSGNIALYRIALVKKIGLEKVEWLEGKHEPLKLTIEEIKQIKRKYQLLCKALSTKEGE